MNAIAMNITSRLALCLGILVAPFASGCVAGADASADDEVGETAEALAPPPASCADILAGNPGAHDGPYTLYIGHDPHKPWTAFCHDMPSAPAEYLSLQNLGPGANFSQYTAGDASPGTNVVTRFSKIRIDPASLLVDIADETFSTSSGSLANGSTTVTSMPYGVAMSCDDTASGVGNVDVTGTPFAVVAGQFVQGGADNAGTSTYSANDHVVNLTGGGYCGWTCSGADPETFNPFNTTGTFQLGLVYAP